MLDGPGYELPLLLGILPARLQRGDPIGFSPGWVPYRRRDRRNLLGAFPEDVPLQLLEVGLQGGELLALLAERIALLLDQGALLDE